MSAFDDYLNAAPAAQPAPSFDAYLNAQVSNPPTTASAAPANNPGVIGSLGAGLGHGVGSTVLGLQQLAGHGLTALGSDHVGPWLTKDAESGIANLDAQYAPFQESHPVVAGAGNIAGNIAATAPLAAFVPGAGGASLLGRIGSGAALGAAGGAATPVKPGADFASEKLSQIGIGAGLGGVAAPLTGLVGDMISGAGGNAQRELAAKGVTMTPGQVMGGGWSTLENKLTSVPIVGDIIRGGQQRAVQDFNRAAYNEVLAPLGKKYAGPVGNDGIQAVKDTIGKAYGDALAKMTFRATDPAFQSDINNLASMAQNLPPAQQQAFMNVLKMQIFGKLGPKGDMDGQTLKGVQSELSRIARGYNGDPSFDNRQLGAAIGEIRNAVDNSLPRYNPQDAVKALSNANSAYANFVRVRGAAASQGAMNNEGIFTPAQLQNAVKTADKSVGKGNVATGNALMQDFSGNAMRVLGKSYPDSGTAGRIGTAGAIGAIAAHPSVLMNPAMLGAAVPALAYTPYGQKLAQALLMSRPASAKAIGSAVNRFLSPVAATGIPALANSPQR